MPIDSSTINTIVNTSGGFNSIAEFARNFYLILIAVGCAIAWLFRFISSKFRNSRKSKGISDYFKSRITDGSAIDYFLFPFGLRKTIPFMDWLYLEYIKFLNETHNIKNLVIFPTIYGGSETELDLNEFSDNIRKIFKDLSSIVIDIRNPYKDNLTKDDLISEDFIKILKYLGNKKYFKDLQEIDQVRVRSILDFNKFRPEEDKVKNLFIHIYKGLCVVNYIKSILQDNDTVSLNFAALFWEYDVDKLGVISSYFKTTQTRHNFFPFLGRTIRYKSENYWTFCIFDNIVDIIDKDIDVKSACDFKKINLVLKSVLNCNENDIHCIRDNGENLWKTKNNNEKNKNIVYGKWKYKNEYYLFLGLIDKIQSKYTT